MKQNKFTAVIVIAASVFSAFAFISCSRKTGLKYSSGSAYTTEEAVAYRDSVGLNLSSAKRANFSGAGYNPEGALYEASEAAPEMPVEPENTSYERKLIKSGNVSLEVQNLSETEEKIKAWAESLGGFIENSYTSERDASVTVRVPSSSFESAMETAGKFGTLKNKNIYSEDVSEQFYDLQTRLETKKVMRERLQKYLAQAKDIKEMLQIERELNSVISDIESMEGRLKRLSGQIDYSKITVSYSLPYRSTEHTGFELPDFGYGFRKFISTVVDFFAIFLKVVLYLVIFGVPVVALVALLYWLLLGKLGLLKKLFIKLSGKDFKKDN